MCFIDEECLDDVAVDADVDVDVEEDVEVAVSSEDLGGRDEMRRDMMTEIDCDFRLPIIAEGKKSLE